METLSKLYLELAHVVPPETKSFRDIENEREIDLLRKAVVRYCDRSRMGTVEPMELQQVIDRAFQAEH